MDRVDLEQLNSLCELAYDVCALRELGPRGVYNRFARDVIGMRHDVDDRGWASTLAMARWEAARGRRSTFYFLHTAPYWRESIMSDTLHEIRDLGHEIGIHNNALTVWWHDRTQNPHAVLHFALKQLRDWSGAEVRSTAGHGDDACYWGHFVNYTMFKECPSPGLGWQTIQQLGLEARSLSSFGLDFAGDHLPRSIYLSDSGDQWSDPIADVIAAFPGEMNTIVLQHPDWYALELFADESSIGISEPLS